MCDRYNKCYRCNKIIINIDDGFSQFGVYRENNINHITVSNYIGGTTYIAPNGRTSIANILVKYWEAEKNLAPSHYSTWECLDFVHIAYQMENVVAETVVAENIDFSMKYNNIWC